jgi:hypothetical protein
MPEPPAHSGEGGSRNPAPRRERGFTDFPKRWFGGGPQDDPAVPADRLPAFAPPGVALEALPVIDAVAIVHNHTIRLGRTPINDGVRDELPGNASGR